MRVSDKEKTVIKYNLTNRKENTRNFCQWIASHIRKNVTIRFSFHEIKTLIDTQLLIDPQVILYLKSEQENRFTLSGIFREEMQA